MKGTTFPQSVCGFDGANILNILNIGIGMVQAKNLFRLNLFPISPPTDAFSHQRSRDHRIIPSLLMLPKGKDGKRGRLVQKALIRQICTCIKPPFSPYFAGDCTVLFPSILNIFCQLFF
jgi:hypothetical protein